MSEQDATDADDRPEAESSNGETPSEDLDDIAEEPAGDLDEALSAIMREEESTDDETDTQATDESLPDPEAVEVDEQLLSQIEQASAETTARAVAMLRQRTETLEGRLDERDAEVDDLEDRLKHKQADFQNYKKRQKKRMEEEKERATEDLVRRLLDVRDNLRRALDQDDDTDIRSGVETTLRQFDEQFERENVTPIEPEPGVDVDPQRHEALATIASDQPEDTVAEVHRPGYEMAGKVIRPAQVAVSDGSEADE